LANKGTGGEGLSPGDGRRPPGGLEPSSA